MKKIRVLLNAGGSGGHIYPLLAVAEKLKQKAATDNLNLEMRFYGQPGEYELLLKSAGIAVRKIAASKYRRYLSILNFIDALKFLWSLPQALWKIFWFMPDIAFSKGGPGALAVLYVCRFYRIPVIIHESDAIPSLTTKRAAGFAKLVELAFESAAPQIGHERIHITGNPIREDLIFTDKDLSPEAKLSAKRSLKLDEAQPLILVLGGSQGALLINDFILKTGPELLKFSQIIHQTGVGHYSAFMNVFKKISASWPPETRSRYRSVPFLQHDLRVSLLAADLIISRAGAGAIFEIAAAGKPSILIPLQSSANDHQNENAFQYKSAGACEIIREENLEPTLAASIIKNLLADPAKLQKMSENAKIFSKPNAVELIAKDILATSSNSNF